MVDHTQILLNRSKAKKATINPKNNDVNCFQYKIAVPLNYEQVKKDSKIRLFINQYEWKNVNVFHTQETEKKFEIKNK